MHRVVGFVMMELQVGGKPVEAFALGRSDQLKGNCAPRPRKPEPPEPATRSLVASARRLCRLLTRVFAVSCGRHQQDGELGHGLRAPWG